MQDDLDASLADAGSLERAMDEGLVRGIGVSNFSERQLAELIRVARVKPAVNQTKSTRGCPRPSPCGTASPRASR